MVLIALYGILYKKITVIDVSFYVLKDLGYKLNL